MKQGKRPCTKLLSLLLLPPCPKVKVGASEDSISHALLSALKFSQYFIFWISRASPRNSFQRTRNSNFYFCILHPSATGILPTGRKARTFQISDLPVSVLPAGGCGGSASPQTAGRGDALLPLEAVEGKPHLRSCFSPAQEGDGISLSLFD